MGRPRQGEALQEASAHDCQTTGTTFIKKRSCIRCSLLFKLFEKKNADAKLFELSLKNCAPDGIVVIVFIVFIVFFTRRGFYS